MGKGNATVHGIDVRLKSAPQYPGDTVHGPVDQAEMVQVEDAIPVRGEYQSRPVGSPRRIAVRARGDDDRNERPAVRRDDGDVPGLVRAEDRAGDLRTIGRPAGRVYL